MISLIKPQFEAGREKVGKKGVVRDEKVHVEVIEKIFDFIDVLDFEFLALDYSPIKGPEGNIEYLCYIEKSENPEILCDTTAQEVVEASYNALN